jgi:hypothetical protein
LLPQGEEESVQEVVYHEEGIGAPTERDEEEGGDEERSWKRH